MVGYLRHVRHDRRMPQILARAGIADAVVWRGVPNAIDGHVFTWLAPDGSAVRCEYLCLGYGQANDLFDLDDRIERKLDVYLSVMHPFFGDDEILAMYGEDHSLPLPGYAGGHRRLQRSPDRFEVCPSRPWPSTSNGLRERSRPTRSWTGELRSSARANVLMGVASHRIEVKQAAGRAERWLERRAEPLLALHGDAWPTHELEMAWRRVIEDSAHDSVSACSCEETIQQVLTRYAEAEQIGRALVERTLARVGARAPTGSWVVWNPSPIVRTGLVEISVPADAGLGASSGGLTPVGTQDLGVEQPILDDRPVPAPDVVGYLRTRLHGRELYGYQVNGFDLDPGDPSGGNTTVTIDVSTRPDPIVLDIDDLLDRIDAAAVAVEFRNPGAIWRLRVVPQPQRRLLVEAPAPGLGWTVLVPGALPGEAPIAHPVEAGERRLSNGLVSVVVDADGTLTIGGSGVTLSGVGRIVDGGDAGDSYNYAPPRTDTLVGSPTACRVSTLEHGPLRGTVLVERRFDWPVGLAEDGGRSDGTVSTAVITTVELRAGEAFVRLRVEFDNQSRDHRVRFHVPLPGPVGRSFAEGQFAIVERGLTWKAGTANTRCRRSPPTASSGRTARCSCSTT